MIKLNLQYYTEKVAVTSSFLLGILGGPLFVMAAPIATCNNLIVTLNRISQFGGGILLTVAVIVLLVSAFYFLFGGASEDAQKKAKSYLIYGITGVAVGLVAFSLPTLVQNILNINLAACPN